MCIRDRAMPGDGKAPSRIRSKDASCRPRFVAWPPGQCPGMDERLPGSVQKMLLVVQGLLPGLPGNARGWKGAFQD
eukprot:8554895-Prorocentrum_lima.AAC.1